MVALIGALISIAASIGLSALSVKMSKDSYTRDAVKAQENGVSATQVLADINAILNKASELGTEKFNEIQNKISRFTTGSSAIVGSNAVNNVINNIKAKLNNVADTYEKSINSFNNQASSIQQQASSLAAMSDDYRNSSAGKNEIKNVKDKATDLVSRYEQSIKGGN